MRRLPLPLLMLAGYLSLAASAGAQGKGGVDIAGSSAALLNMPSVQKDLALSPEQIAKGKTLAEEFQAEISRSVMSAIGNPFELAKLGPAERDAKMKQIKEKAELLARSMTERYKPKAAAILTPEQTTRLQQIGWQSSGAAALADPQVTSALALTPEQQEKVGGIVKDYAEKQTGVMSIASITKGDQTAALAKFEELGDERDAAAAKVLDQEQVAKYKELVGKPFDAKGLRADMIKAATASATAKPATPPKSK